MPLLVSLHTLQSLVITHHLGCKLNGCLDLLDGISKIAGSGIFPTFIEDLGGLLHILALFLLLSLKPRLLFLLLPLDLFLFLLFRRNLLFSGWARNLLQALNLRESRVFGRLSHLFELCVLLLQILFGLQALDLRMLPIQFFLEVGHPLLLKLHPLFRLLLAVGDELLVIRFCSHRSGKVPDHTCISLLSRLARLSFCAVSCCKSRVDLLYFIHVRL